MEVRSTARYAGWYGSYVEEDQGKCLIYALQERQQQLESLLKNILSEIELVDDPREYSDAVVLESIRFMIQNTKPIERQVGYFKWIAGESFEEN